MFLLPCLTGRGNKNGKAGRPGLEQSFLILVWGLLCRLCHGFSIILSTNHLCNGILSIGVKRAVIPFFVSPKMPRHQVCWYGSEALIYHDITVKEEIDEDLM
jgi:hypothetical protein